MAQEAAEKLRRTQVRSGFDIVIGLSGIGQIREQKAGARIVALTHQSATEELVTLRVACVTELRQHIEVWLSIRHWPLRGVRLLQQQEIAQPRLG